MLHKKLFIAWQQGRPRDEWKGAAGALIACDGRIGPHKPRVALVGLLFVGLLALSPGGLRYLRIACLKGVAKNFAK